MTELAPFLKSLISLPGLSGYEGPVREVIAEAWRPLVDELSVSRMGSLHGLRRGTGGEPRRRILLAAHMDAIGLMVTTNRGGLLHFTEIGGVDPRILPGTPVTVHGRRDLPGVVVQPSDKLLPADIARQTGGDEAPAGRYRPAAGEVSQLVRTGDLISFAQPPLDLAGDVMAGHTLDNRASVAAVTALPAGTAEYPPCLGCVGGGHGAGRRNPGRRLHLGL